MTLLVLFVEVVDNLIFSSCCTCTEGECIVDVAHEMLMLYVICYVIPTSIAWMLLLMDITEPSTC